MAVAGSDGAGAQPAFGAELLDALPVAVFVLDGRGHPTYANAGAEELLGARVVRDTTPHMLGETYHAVVAGTDVVYPAEQMPVVRALDGETSEVHDMEIVRADGRVALDVWAAPVRDGSGAVTHAVAVFVDATRRRQAEASLARAERELRVAFRDAPIGMALVGVDGRFLRVNREMATLVGRPEQELLELGFRDVTHPDDVGADEELMAELLAGARENYQIEKRYVRRDGEVRWAVLSRSVVRDDRGAVVHFVTHAEDITARREAIAGLVHQALHDPLTGLANRTLLLDRVQHALDRLPRHPATHGVIYFDVDRLKAINDGHGHIVGDAALTAFASVLRTAIRPSDTAARLGGDEFVVFCEDVAGEEEARLILRRIEDALTNVTVGDSKVQVFASAGIAVTGPHHESASQLIHRADLAMYQAKSARP